MFRRTPKPLAWFSESQYPQSQSLLVSKCFPQCGQRNVGKFKKLTMDEMAATKKQPIDTSSLAVGGRPPLVAGWSGKTVSLSARTATKKSVHSKQMVSKR